VSSDIGYSATAATPVQFTSPGGAAAGFALSSPSVGLQLRRAGYVAVRDPEAFAAIFEKARTQNVQIAMFGDSNETYPTGFGDVYVPRLNYEMWRYYRRAGLSPLGKGYASYGGAGNSMYLLAGVFSGTAETIVASSVPSSATLPGISSAIYKSTALGKLTKLTTANDLTPTGAEIRGISVWPSGDETYAILYGKQRSGSSDGFLWRSSPTNNTTGVAEFFLANTATGTLSLGLDNAAGGYVSGEVGPLPWNGLARQQLVVRGDDTNGAEFFGARYRNASTPGGIVFDSFSAGGYTTLSLANNHADAGPQLAAFGPWDAIALHYGVNDISAGTGVTAAQYKDNVTALISTLRGANWLNDAEMKFIIFTDPFRSNNTATQQEQLALQFSALSDLAAEDDKVMVCNTYQWLSDRLGWNASGYEPYLISDKIHYSPLGARAVAAADAYLMLNGAT
jgi:lysophospholipase L1-like esterase